MSAHPSPELRSLFEAALNEFENRAGTKLLQHQVFNKLVACQSIESVLGILQEQTKPLRTSPGDDTTLMKCIKRTVHVLYSLSTNEMVVSGASLVCGFLCSSATIIILFSRPSLPQRPSSQELLFSFLYVSYLGSPDWSLVTSVSTVRRSEMSTR